MTSNKTDKYFNKKVKEVFAFKGNDEIDEFRADTIHLDIIHEIKNIMDDRNITKAELAQKLNTSKSFITQLFAGDKLLNLKTIAKVERILDTNFRCHFNNKINPHKISCEIFELYPTQHKQILISDYPNYGNEISSKVEYYDENVKVV